MPDFHIQILFNHCRCKYVWSVKFKNFLNFIFGRFLQFGSAVRQPAVLFSCCAFNCEEEENGHLAPISVLKYLQTGNHLYFLIHFCFSSLLPKWKVSSPFCYFLVYFCTYFFCDYCEIAFVNVIQKFDDKKVSRILVSCYVSCLKFVI